MNIIPLGDIHGRDMWKEILSKNIEWDKAIFIGDYFDAKEDITPQQQIDNFKEIIEFKRKLKDNVILLFGNHDYHYLKTSKEQYSGFQMWQKTEISDLLHQAIDQGLLQVCFAYKHFLFSHAGIIKTWCKDNDINIEDGSMEQSINDLLLHKPNSFRFTPGVTFNNYGDDVCQGPTWVRLNSLQKDGVENVIHVVGHTMQENLNIMLNEDKKSGVIMIDTLGTTQEYLNIIDEEVFINKL